MWPARAPSPGQAPRQGEKGGRKKRKLRRKKKVAVVQSLIHNPRLLILDEPTSGLDPLIQNHLFDILNKQNEKGTTIFFLHTFLVMLRSFVTE